MPRPALPLVIAFAVSLAGALAVAADSTLFDLEKDLAKFFALQDAVIRTEATPNDTPVEAARKQAARADVFKKHGIRDEKHWAKENDVAMRFSWTKKAQRIYGGEEAIADMRRAAGEGKTLEAWRQDRARAEEARSADLQRMKLINDASAFDRSLLAPIDGITLEKYAAAANASMFHGDDFAAVTKETGVTEKAFEALTEKWTARMRADPTRILMKRYGGHLMSAGRGRYAASARDLGQAMLKDAPLLGPEPVPFEKWVEIGEFYASRSAKMDTPAAVTRELQPYGLTFYEWNIVSNWWARKRTEHIEKDDREFLARWQAMREKYRLKFASGG